MRPGDARARRALLHRTLIPIEVYPEELHSWIELLEQRAVEAIDISEGYADYFFRRIAELREAAR
jgi:hypothetical protein